MARKRVEEVEAIETAPTAELPHVDDAERAPAAPKAVAGEFGKLVGGAKVKAAMRAYAQLRKELEGEGDFPEWAEISERAKNLYLEAVEHCLGEGTEPRTRFEQIVCDQMA